MHRQYGDSTISCLLYRCIRLVVYFFALFIYGLLLHLFLKIGYITESIYELCVLFIVLSSNLFFKTENQFAFIPYLIRIPDKAIRKHILVKELLSPYNYIILPLIIPIISTISANYSYLSLIALITNSYLLGLFINLSMRIIKFACNKYKLFYVTTISIISLSLIALVLFRHIDIELSYINLLSNYFFAFALLIGIMLLIPAYMRVIKLEFYLIYDSDIKHETTSIINSFSVINNIFDKLQIYQLIRTKGGHRFIQSILFYIIGGILLCFAMDLKLIGITLYLGAYTLNMLQFTIYVNSGYFDFLYVRDISIKSLIFKSFYTNLVITFILFIPIFIYNIIYEKNLILPTLSIFLYIIGPVSLILLINVLFAQKYDCFKATSDFSSTRTYSQKIIGAIAGGSLFIAFLIINFFSQIGCYIIIVISITFFMIHQYLIYLLYKEFMNRRYEIMENLRK